VVDAIAGLGPLAKDAVPGLSKWLDSDDFLLRTSVEECLAEIGVAAKDAIPQLLEALNQHNDMEAKRALVAIGPTCIDAVVEAIPTLDRRNGAQVAGLGVLGMIGEAAVPAYTKLLQSDDAYVSSSALLMVPQFGEFAGDLIPVIAERFLKDGAAFQIPAVSAIKELGPSVLPQVLKQISTADSEIRVRLIDLLASAGWKDKRIVPALKEAARSENESVRSAANSALKRLDQSGK
jgi:HEAT repeat protein